MIREKRVPYRTPLMHSIFHSGASRPNTGAQASRRRVRQSVGALLLLALGAGTAQAQADAGPMVLRIPASTRALGMANAGLGITDADALFYNPALLFGARGMAVSVQRYGRFGTSGTLANVVTVGSMNIGVGAQVLDWSALPLSYHEVTRLG